MYDWDSLTVLKRGGKLHLHFTELTRYYAFKANLTKKGFKYISVQITLLCIMYKLRGEKGWPPKLCIWPHKFTHERWCWPPPPSNFLALFQALCVSVTFSEFVKSKSFKEKHLGKKVFSSLFKKNLIFWEIATIKLLLFFVYNYMKNISTNLHNSLKNILQHSW